MIAILKVIESFLISFWKVVLKLLFITIPKYLFNQCVKMLKWFFSGSLGISNQFLRDITILKRPYFFFCHCL